MKVWVVFSMQQDPEGERYGLLESVHANQPQGVRVLDPDTVNGSDQHDWSEFCFEYEVKS